MHTYSINIAHGGRHWGRVHLPNSETAIDARLKARKLERLLNAEGDGFDLTLSATPVPSSVQVPFQDGGDTE